MFIFEILMIKPIDYNKSNAFTSTSVASMIYPQTAP